jgi:hypothetical protein
MRSTAITGVTFLCGFWVGCSGNDSPPPPAPQPVAVVASPGKTTIGNTESNGLHIDDGAEIPLSPQRATKSGRGLEILLRSTPPGALAMVDGIPMGPTPVLWQGNFTGGEHEFTFSMAGYSAARYRFVPISSGIVHGQLEELNELDGRDSKDVRPQDGAPLGGRVPPSRSTVPTAAIPPPATVVTSADARTTDAPRPDALDAP